MVKGKARAVRLPAEWQPTPSHETRALEDGIDLQRQVEKFKAHAAANDRRQVNWNASFTTWLLGVPTWERGRPSTGQTLPFPDNGTQDEKDEWARSQPRAAGGWS